MSTARPATTDQTTQVHGADTAMAHWPVVSPRHSGDWGVHCLACSIDAGDYVPRCLVSADEWPPLVLRGAQPADDAAPRASEAVRGDGSPTSAEEAVRGGEGGSATESELRAHFAEAFRRAAYQHEPICDEDGCECDVWLDSDYGDTISVSGKVDALAEVAAAVTPLIRAQVADEIEAAALRMRNEIEPYISRDELGAYRHAARIARGDQ